jgi:hypothetical protein
MSDKDPKKFDDDKKVVEQENSSIEFLFSFEIYSPKVQPIRNNEPVKPLKSIEFTLNPYPKNTTSKEKRQEKSAVSTKQQDDISPLKKATENADEEQDEKDQDIVKYEIEQSQQQQQQQQTEKQDDNSSFTKVTEPMDKSLFSLHYLFNTSNQQEVEGQNTAVSIIKNEPNSDDLLSELIQEEEEEEEEENGEEGENEESTNHNYLFYF